MSKRKFTSEFILIVIFILIFASAIVYLSMRKETVPQADLSLSPIQTAASQNFISTPAPYGSMTSTKTVAPNPVSTTVPIRSVIEERTINQKYEHVNTSIHYPEIMNINNSEITMVERQTMNSFNTTMFEYASTFTDIAAEMEMQALTSSQWSIGQKEVILDYDIKLNNENFISFCMNSSSISDGAHGINKKFGMTFDLKKGQIIKLSDLFKKDSEYVDALTGIIKSQMKSKNITNDFDQFKKIKTDQNFYLAGDKLVVIFSTYEYGPYSSGLAEFEIPFKQIRSILNI